MRITTPDFAGAQDRDKHERAWQGLQNGLRAAVSRSEATDRLLLRDTDGMTWAITITTAGALTIAAFDGKTRDV